MLSDEAHLLSVKSETFTDNICNQSISELRDVRYKRALSSNSSCNVLDKKHHLVLALPYTPVYIASSPRFSDWIVQWTLWAEKRHQVELLKMWHKSAILEKSKMAAANVVFFHFRPLYDVFPYCNVKPLLQRTENGIDWCFQFTCIICLSDKIKMAANKVRVKSRFCQISTQKLNFWICQC